MDGRHIASIAAFFFTLSNRGRGGPLEEDRAAVTGQIFSTSSARTVPSPPPWKGRPMIAYAAYMTPPKSAATPETEGVHS